MCCRVLNICSVLNVLQCVKCVAVDVCTMRGGAAGVMQCVAMCHSVVQCVTACCSALQCVATACNRHCGASPVTTLVPQTPINTPKDSCIHCKDACKDSKSDVAALLGSALLSSTQPHKHSKRLLYTLQRCL